MKSFLRRKETRWALLAIFTLILITAVLGATEASALSSQFRKKFIFNRRANMLLAQEALIRDNKEIIPTEIELFIADALAYKNTFEEKMYLLDNAKAMASSYFFQFGDESFLKKIISIQDMELAKQETAQIELARWKGYMELRGSIVMKEHLPQMEAAGLEPVVYPHWMHKILFKCTACHDPGFTPLAGSNDITHEKFANGEQCATCHDGNIAFATDSEGECTRCHITGGAEGTTPYAFIDNESISAAASRVGAVWKPENLTDAKLPLDALGAIDWIELAKSGAIGPIDSIYEEPEIEQRDNVIVFATEGTSVEEVAFSHSTHSSQIRCATCHKALFTTELGASDMHMAEMSKGKHCGSCHGTVSFPLTDCARCHTVDPENRPEGALIRTK